MTLPTGQQIDRVAIAMAAAVGRPWSTLDEAGARTFRVMAQAALLSPVGAAMAVQAPDAAAILVEAAQGVRMGMRALDGIDEGAIRRLFKIASDLELLARVCEGLAVDEEGV